MNLKNTLKQLKKAEEAVSPVVATLLLVLVAAGGAIGVGVFLQNYGNKQTEKVQGVDSDNTLTIGGSSTVFPMTESAIPGFEALNKGIDVVNGEGGSGAGVRSLCQGRIDIAASSAKVKATGDAGKDFATCPDFNNDGKRDAGLELREFPVAMDAIVVAWSSSNTHCPNGVDMSIPMVREIYARNLEGSTYTAAYAGTAITGLTTSTTPYTWAAIAGCSGTEVIKVLQRYDPGGTEDAFCSLIMDSPLSEPGVTTPVSDCSSGSLKLAGTKYDATANPTGTALEFNENLEARVKADLDAMTFISFGNANGDSGLKLADLAALPTLANPVQAKDANVKDGVRLTGTVATQYPAARTLYYYTAGEPSAIEQLFLDYVLEPQHNADIASAHGYVGYFT